MKFSAKAIFLDRDGVINRKAPEGSYISSLAEVEYLPGAIEGIAELTRKGYEVIVVTNQRGIARGLVTRDALQAIHEDIVRRVTGAGGRVTAVYVCDHEIADQCHCRKPKPGMLRRAQVEYEIDMSASWMVGDSRSDIEAGRSAGCRTALVASLPPGDGDDSCDLRVASLWDFAVGLEPNSVAECI